jgi:lipoyl(octanoyl) transferase
MSTKQIVQFKDLGLQHSYKHVWEYQEALLQKALAIKQQTMDADPATRTTEHHLIFTEHAPVYTLGKSGDVENILISETDMKISGIEFFKINRGGDITFHGPGQLVGYPILDLEKMYTDIGKYLRNLEEVIIKTIAHYGLAGTRSTGETGVWLQPDNGPARKICAMGVRCSRWVTMHGWALNVNTNLDYFKNIIPCGIANKDVTSIERELGTKIDFEETKKILLQKFEEVFDVEVKEN